MGLKNIFICVIASCVACFCSDSPDDIQFCTEEFVYGLNVIVKDASTNTIIVDDITIIAIDGSYQEELMVFEGSSNFVGAGEREGNYILEVTSNHYQTYISPEIQVDADDCHVIPEVVEINLLPN